MTLSSNTSIYIEGNNSGNNLWEFQLSDSIYERSQKMMLVVPSADNIVHQLTLTYTMTKDTIRTVDFYIKKKLSKLKLEYIDSHTEEKVSYLMYKDAIFDHFHALIDNSEFESSTMKLYTAYQFLINSYSYEEKSLAYHVSADDSFKEIRLQNAEERDKLLGKYFLNKPVQGFRKKE